MYIDLFKSDTFSFPSGYHTIVSNRTLFFALFFRLLNGTFTNRKYEIETAQNLSSLQFSRLKFRAINTIVIDISVYGPIVLYVHVVFYSVIQIQVQENSKTHTNCAFMCC